MYKKREFVHNEEVHIHSPRVHKTHIHTCVSLRFAHGLLCLHTYNMTFVLNIPTLEERKEKKKKKRITTVVFDDRCGEKPSFPSTIT